MSLKKSKQHPAIKYDRDGIPMDDPSLKGLTRYFNSATIRGRANVAKATLTGLCLFYVYKKLCPSTQVVEPPVNNEIIVLSSQVSNAGPYSKKDDEIKPKSMSTKDQVYWEVVR